MKVENWMQKDVVSVTPGDDLLKVDRLMTAYQIRHLPVLDENRRLVGILSDRDLRDHSLPTGMGAVSASNQRRLKLITVGEIMTSKVISIAPGDSMKKAVHLMKSRKITALPVMKGPILVGMLTTIHLLKFLDNHLSPQLSGQELEIPLGRDPAETARLAARLLEILSTLNVAYTSIHLVPQPTGETLASIVADNPSDKLSAALKQAGFSPRSPSSPPK